MANRKYAPTIKDVAQEAGVAMGTVSKVINGIPVNKDYRIRVEKAIEKLNYRVNIYAQGMRRSCTHTIEVMIPNLINPFFVRLVHFINRELSQRNYKMMLSTTDGNPYEEQAYVFLAEQQRVDGLICLSYNLKLEMPKNFPVVSIDRYYGVPYLEGKELPCSTIVQPMERIAKSCVDLVLDYRPNISPSLVCLPVTYAYGGTTRQ